MLLKPFGDVPTSGRRCRAGRHRRPIPREEPELRAAAGRPSARTSHRTERSRRMTAPAPRRDACRRGTGSGHCPNRRPEARTRSSGPCRSKRSSRGRTQTLRKAFLEPHRTVRNRDGCRVSCKFEARHAHPSRDTTIPTQRAPGAALGSAQPHRRQPGEASGAERRLPNQRRACPTDEWAPRSVWRVCWWSR